MAGLAPSRPAVVSRRGGSIRAARRTSVRVSAAAEGEEDGAVQLATARLPKSTDVAAFSGYLCATPGTPNTDIANPNPKP